VKLHPKTIAALHPERIAFPASIILKFLLTFFYPIVWLLNQVTTPLLKMLGVDSLKKGHDQLSPEELRTIVDDAGSTIPHRHQGMLLNILDLESATIEDIMIPRGEMFCIDINDSEAEILQQLEKCEFTRVPVYEDNIDNIIGILHMRNLGKLLSANDFSKDAFKKILREPLFSPEGTGLHMQLMNFQKEKRRIAIIIDEYGTVLGLATLEDILEEIVGDFTSNLALDDDEYEALKDGSFLISGSCSIRDVNRQTGWKLPVDGPKTLSGLVLEHLESFPDALASVKIDNYVIEMLDIKDNVIEKARVFPLKRSAIQGSFLFK
jgi:Mg2+/Co2+ transporter CorB